MLSPFYNNIHTYLFYTTHSPWLYPYTHIYACTPIHLYTYYIHTYIYIYLYGHQLVCHYVGKEYRCLDYYNPVDGDEVPVSACVFVGVGVEYTCQDCNEHTHHHNITPSHPHTPTPLGASFWCCAHVLTVPVTHEQAEGRR